MTKVIWEEQWYKGHNCFSDEYYWIYQSELRVPDDWSPPKSVEEALDWYDDRD